MSQLAKDSICKVTAGKYKHLPVRLIEQVTANAWACLPNGLEQPRLLIKTDHLRFLRQA